jgi:hypothetical protein
MSGNGTTYVAGTSTISGDEINKLLNRVVSNSGTVTYSTSDAGRGIVLGSDPFGLAVLNNSGTFNTTSGGDITSFNNEVHRINNSGTWNVSGVGTTSNIGIRILFDNTGSLNVTGGTAVLGYGGTSTGSFVTSLGSTLAFAAGTHNSPGIPHNLNAGSSVSGAGTVQLASQSIEGVWNFNAGTYNVLGTTVINGGTNNFNSPATSASLNLTGGALSGTSSVAVSGNLAWTGGAMTGNGAISVAGTASTISGTTDKMLHRILTNSGMITYANDDLAGGALFFGNAARLNNVGTFNVTAGGDFNSVVLGTGVINNSGTWSVSGAGTSSNLSHGVAFNNTGTFSVASGTAVLGGGGTSTGAFTSSTGATLVFASGTHNSAHTPHVLNTGSSVSGAGTVELAGIQGVWNFNAGTYNVTGTTAISGGTNNFNAPATTGSLSVTEGALSGSGPLTTTGNLTWSGGLMTGSGTTSAAGSNSTISGGGQKILARTLINTGTITYGLNNSSSLFFGASSGPGVLNNSGTFNTVAGADVNTNFSLPPGPSTINNTGIWNVSADAAASVVGSYIRFNNSGVVSVASGTLELAGGGVSTGSFVVSNQAGLIFTGTANVSDVHHLNAGSMVSGSGNVQIIGGEWNFNAGTYDLTGTTLVTGGVANFNAPASAGALSLTNGFLRGSAAVSTPGNLTWTGGAMSGTGTTTVGGSASIINGTGRKSLARILSNTGTLTYSASDTAAAFIFEGDTAGVINNSGTFETTDGGDFLRNGLLAGRAINNSGVWNVSGPGTTSTISETIAFNNSGTVSVNSGTIAFNGGFNQTAGSLRMNGGNISSSSALNIVSGSLQGTGTVSGGVANSGIISPGSSAGRIDVVGDLTLSNSSKLLFEIGGTTPGSLFDFVTEGGVLPFNPNGDLLLSLINGFNPTGLSFTIFSSNQNLGGATFTNVASGGRVATSDGLGSFQVDYGPTSQNIVLTNFAVVPEPTTWGLLAFGLMTAAAARCRSWRQIGTPTPVL